MVKIDNKSKNKQYKDAKYGYNNISLDKINNINKVNEDDIINYEKKELDRGINDINGIVDSNIVMRGKSKLKSSCNSKLDLILY